MGLENIQNYMIGIVLTIVIVTSGVIMLGGFTTVDSTLDSTDQIGNFTHTLNKSSEISTSVDGISASINSVSSSDTGALGWLNALVGSVFNGLKAIGGTLSFMDSAATETGAMFGIPPEIIGLLLLIVVIIIGFAIWNAIMYGA